MEPEWFSNVMAGVSDESPSAVRDGGKADSGEVSCCCVRRGLGVLLTPRGAGLLSGWLWCPQARWWHRHADTGVLTLSLRAVLVCVLLTSVCGIGVA